MIRIAVSGHRGLSTKVAALVSAGIEAELRQLAPAGSDLVGISCLADGADQIFATAVLNHGGELEVIVPAEAYRDGLPEVVRSRYDEFCRRASRVHRRPYRESNGDAHMAAGRFMVDRADHLIAVWDGLPARGYGGTADVVRYARERGVPVTVVWPDGAHRD